GDKGLQSGNNIDKETKPNTARSSSSGLEMLDGWEMNKCSSGRSIAQIKAGFIARVGQETRSFKNNEQGSSTVPKRKSVLNSVAKQVSQLKRMTGSRKNPLHSFRLILNPPQSQPPGPPQPNTELAAKPAIEPSTKSVTKPATEPANNPTNDPITNCYKKGPSHRNWSTRSWREDLTYINDNIIAMGFPVGDLS
nr:hypothetical protein [Tanacetum cinerariifolium]